MIAPLTSFVRHLAKKQFSLLDNLIIASAVGLFNRGLIGFGGWLLSIAVGVYLSTMLTQHMDSLDQENNE